MTITQAMVEARLGERPYRFFAQVPSTMDAARDWLLEGAPHGAMVIAAHQTAGRGRMGRTWLNADTSALAISFILRVPEAALPQVSMFGGLIALDALRGLDVPDLSLKWPNDVLVGTRKISGVLGETVRDGARLAGAVLGIGINIGGSFGSPDVAGSAISISDALRREPDPARLFSQVIDAFDRRNPDLNTPQMIYAWRARLGTIGRRVRIESAAPFEGIAEDVADNGALLVRDDGGQLHPVLAADVRLRPA